MRTIEWTSAFKRDYKRIRMNPRHRDIGTLLPAITEPLANDRAVQDRHRDHNLGGNWHGHRECHLKPDLLLIDKKPDEKTLRLVRLGSHSDLFAR
ncbi:MAG: type II toxin-antitoxin system YafQ family toxin [Acidobacteriaceae bacterium]